VRYLFGAYDVHADRLHGRLREHKNAGEVLAFFKQIRMRYRPGVRIYLVMDNLSTHKTQAIREWADASNAELIFTPTYASFLNRIGCHFWGSASSSSRTPTTATGQRLPRPWPTTSSTATDRTVTRASSRLNGVS
jgi:DDE superfamily endonuclease